MVVELLGHVQIHQGFGQAVVDFYTVPAERNPDHFDCSRQWWGPPWKSSKSYRSSTFHVNSPAPVVGPPANRMEDEAVVGILETQVALLGHQFARMFSHFSLLFA